MQPLTGGVQKCLTFRLTTDPRAQVFEYCDYLGNGVHHFDIPEAHTRLTIVVESVVKTSPAAPLPDRLHLAAWEAIDRLACEGDYSEMLSPSAFARSSESLGVLAHEFGATRKNDPLSTLSHLSSSIHFAFEYCPQSTKVDSPIEHALRNRKGVCQDFSHIMIAIARELGIPTRYVSGYLYHRTEDRDRSAPDATHAWVEALLPEIGWIGFDPTNNTLAGERHIRVAVGRDYADVAPSRGVFQGDAESELDVAVQVAPADPVVDEDSLPTLVEPATGPEDWHRQQ